MHVELYVLVIFFSFLAYAVYTIKQNEFVQEEWPISNGIIETVEVKPVYQVDEYSARQGVYSIVAQVRYTKDGDQFSRPISFQIRDQNMTSKELDVIYQPGATLKIRINPADPNQIAYTEQGAGPDG